MSSLSKLKLMKLTSVEREYREKYPALNKIASSLDNTIIVDELSVRKQVDRINTADQLDFSKIKFNDISFITTDFVPPECLNEELEKLFGTKKEDIINTALKLFNSHSYNSIGVDRIISESGVAKMTFYKYFPSKEKLIEECLLQRNINLQISLNETLAQCDQSNYLEQIESIFKWYNAWFQSEDFNGCMFQKAFEEVIKIYPSTLEPATQYKIWLTALIQNLLTHLDIRSPTHLATLIVIILDGITIQAHVNKNSVEMSEYWTRVEHLINFEKQITS